MIRITFLLQLLACVVFFLRVSAVHPVEGNGLVGVSGRKTIDQVAEGKRSINKYRGLDRSDDFYLETFANAAPPPGTASGLTNTALLGDDLFYEAVDYESASASYLVRQRHNATNQLSTAKRDKSRLFKVFRVFSWKGFGLSFEKSVIQWNAFGAGIRVPVSSNFPEWDKNANLPKLSTTFGLNYPYGCKMSISASFPLGTAMYGLMLLGKTAGGVKSSLAFTSFLERLKKQKATDSIKRVGVTATIRFSEAKGLQCYIGPQVFYYPGHVVMQHLLPMIFSVPAVLVSIIGLFLQLDNEPYDATVYSKSESITSTSNHLTSTNHTVGEQLIENTSLNRTKSSLKINKKKSNVSTAAPVVGNINKNVLTNIRSISNTTESKNKRRKWRRGRGVTYWHKRILEWAGTKSTGLGYNAGYRYQGLHDASLGSRIVFEIQSFYPFPKTLQRLSTLTLSSFIKPFWSTKPVELEPKFQVPRTSDPQMAMSLLSASTLLPGSEVNMQGKQGSEVTVQGAKGSDLDLHEKHRPKKKTEHNNILEEAKV